MIFKRQLQSGVFASDLGDAMVLALSNVLKVPIVLFTYVLNFPCIPIHPRTCLLTCNPLLLGFLQNVKGGHYCLAVPLKDHEKGTDDEHTTSSTNIKVAN